MAHELTKLADGSYSMLRAADTDMSWHGLETVVPADAPFDVWADHPVFNWQIQRGIVRYNIDREGTQQAYPEQNVLFRSDTKQPLSIVGNEYNIVQPREVLEFFRDVCINNGLKMDTAGIIRGGKKFWALARTGNAFNVSSTTDLVKQYILLASSADSSMATTAKHTKMRVVCSNTFHGSLANGEAAIRVRHNRAFSAEDVKLNLGLLDTDFADFGDYAKEMHKAKIDRNMALRWYAELLMDDDTASPEAIAEFAGSSRVFKGFMGGYEFGKGAEETVWGLFNGITYTIDNVRGRTFDTRFDSAQFGAGAALKQKAWEKAVALIDGIKAYAKASDDVLN